MINNYDSIVLETVDKILKRADIGLTKYGKNLDRDDMNIIEWINNAIEEQMDSILYLTKLKKEIMNKFNGVV